MANPITQRLLASDPAAFRRATQPTFLRHAAQGTLPKETLSLWLANDKLYIQSYTHAAKRLLSALQANHSSTTTSQASSAPSSSSPRQRLRAWTADALTNITREERFFTDLALRYDLSLDLPTATSPTSREDSSIKLEGLQRFEKLFDSLLPPRSPKRGECDHDNGNGWLESAIVFYGTEKCYLEAWTWAKSQMSSSSRKGGDGSEKIDLDGGAVRDELVENWSSPAFGAFVERLGCIVDDAVAEQMMGGEDGALWRRSLALWRELLAAEETFWPVI